MKKITKLVLIALAAHSSIILMASEAYTPISYGTKSRGMAGVSIATVQGAESGFSNPALLSFIEKNEVSIGGTYRKENTDITFTDAGTKYSYSNTDESISPYICFNYHLTDNFNIGVGVTDYLLKNTLENVFSYEIKLRKTRLSIPVSYSKNNFSFGATLIYEKMNYNSNGSDWSDNYSDNNFGYDLGLAYKFSNIGLLVAIDYKSKIEHSFDYNATDQGQINSASEIGIGLSWNILNTAHQIGLDYKRINSSEIIKDTAVTTNFTQDQNVFAIGYMYNAKKWQARIGYRYVSDLYISDDTSAIGIIFPFSTTSHYTVGGSYQLNEHLSTDIALLYASYKHTNNNWDGPNTSFTVENNPVSLSLGINYDF